MALFHIGMDIVVAYSISILSLFAQLIDFVDLLQLIGVLAHYITVCWRDIAIGLCGVVYALILSVSVKTSRLPSQKLWKYSVKSTNQSKSISASTFKLAFHETKRKTE